MHFGLGSAPCPAGDGQIHSCLQQGCGHFLTWILVLSVHGTNQLPLLNHIV